MCPVGVAADRLSAGSSRSNGNPNTHSPAARNPATPTTLHHIVHRSPSCQASALPRRGATPDPPGRCSNSRRRFSLARRRSAVAPRRILRDARIRDLLRFPGGEPPGYRRGSLRDLGSPAGLSMLGGGGVHQGARRRRDSFILGTSHRGYLGRRRRGTPLSSKPSRPFPVAERRPRVAGGFNPRTQAMPSHASRRGATPAPPRVAPRLQKAS